MILFIIVVALLIDKILTTIQIINDITSITDDIILTSFCSLLVLFFLKAMINKTDDITIKNIVNGIPNIGIKEHIKAKIVNTKLTIFIILPL